MGRPHTRRAVRIATPLTALVCVLVAGSSQVADATATTGPPLAVGTIAATPVGATPAAEPSDATTINVDIALQPRNAAELTTYAQQVSDPNSPLYKQYLTKAQTQLLFAPTSAEVNSVSVALRAAGLDPRAATDDNLDIPVTTSIGRLESAFQIGFAGFRLANGRTAFNATSVPKFAPGVASAVRGVIGLDDFATPKDNVATPATTGASTAGAIPASGHRAVPSMCASLTSSIDAYLARHGYTGKDGGTYYSPTALASAYGYTSLLRAGTEGQGVTVAVEEWEAPDRQALAEYQNCVGSRNAVDFVSDGATSPVQPTPANFVGVETAIDIESVESVAPRARIIDYEGPDDTDNFTDADWLNNFAAPVADDTAQAISLSWLVGCEDGAVDTPLENSQTTTLQLAAVQGQSFFAASGDNGSEGCAEPQLNVSDPADNPWLTSVGGTYMQGLTNPMITPWNDSFDTSATEGIGLLDNGGATGGGVSTVHSFTSGWNYQAGFTAPGYDDVCKASAGGACRQVPDLSALGDWRSGFALIYYADNTGYDVLMVAGTSLATPIMAGMTALAGSSARCAANGRAGFINPLIYDLARNPATYAANFTDETTGDNAYTPSGYQGSHYRAATGYDLASGLGSPKAPNLITSLCAPNRWIG